MEMSHQAGAEAESLLRPENRGVVMQGQKRWDVEGEKAPFLRNEPVKLTPAWEGSNLPNDTLNLKGVGMDLVPPRDRGHLIYFTMILHGLGTLTAWNMFITAQTYFEEYKLKGAPEYAAHYMTYVGWASQLPNLVFSWINIFMPMGGSLTARIVWSLMIEVFLFVFTVLLAMVDTSQHPEVFFWCTMLTVFLLNTFNAIFQNSVYGVAGRLPQSYTGAVVLGSNICGTLVVCLSWASSGLGNVRTAAIYYFIGGMFVLLLCFDTYFALPLNRYYRYHETLQQRSLRHAPALAASQPPAKRPPFGRLMRQSSVQLYNVFIVFFVSLAVFPAVQSKIVSSSGLFGGNFTLLTCFLTFNLMAMVGNVTASLVHWPSPRWLVIFTTVRIIFIPFFLMCKYNEATRTLPVWVDNDVVYWLVSALLGWSSGHGSSLAMMYVGGTVDPEHSSTAGMLGAAMLVTGIVSGITFSRLCPVIVDAHFWTTL